MTRTAGEIGAGLTGPRQARPIRTDERIHIVGVAGAGASAAALLAHAAGAAVSGCDAGGESPYTPALHAAGIRIAGHHDAAHVTADPPPTRLAVTKALTAIAPDHPELAAAAAAGVPVEPWQQLVADAAAGRRLVAVAGTHGKSTTSGWLVHVLVTAGQDPSAFVGALLPGTVTPDGPATARVGRGDLFVVEADEYAGNFDAYHPEVIVLTSAEWDHPDVFRDRDAVLAAFEAWIWRAADGVPDARVPVLVANVGDPGVAEVVGRLGAWRGRLVAVALVDVAPQRIGGFARGITDRFRTAPGAATVVLGRITDARPDATRLDIHGLDALTGPVSVALPMAGRHNAANALGVAGACLAIGLQPALILDGLASFPGIGRRLEFKGEAGNVVVYDDYGHHPTAIRETIAAIRQREPGRRVWAVYEPLTYHRTAALLGDFGSALASADAVAVADIWAGRDPDTSITSPQALVAAVVRLRPEIPIAATGSAEQTADWLAGEVRAGDAVLVMGGGRSYRIGERLLERLRGADE